MFLPGVPVNYSPNQCEEGGGFTYMGRVRCFHSRALFSRSLAYLVGIVYIVQIRGGLYHSQMVDRERAM